MSRAEVRGRGERGGERVYTSVDRDREGWYPTKSLVLLTFRGYMFARPFSHLLPFCPCNSCSIGYLSWKGSVFGLRGGTRSGTTRGDGRSDQQASQGSVSSLAWDFGWVFFFFLFFFHCATFSLTTPLQFMQRY